MQGGISIFVNSIDLTTFFEQQSHHIQLAMECRCAKGSVSSFHWTIRVRTRSERLQYDGTVTYPNGGS